jgi:hypothetical protein
MKNSLKLLMLALASMQFSGCASFVAPTYSPHYEAIDQTRKVNADRIVVGTVQPTDPAADVNSISLRAASLKSASGSFAKYLEDALVSDLTEMGFYDAAGTTRIDATLLKNDIDISSLSVGSGLLEANIKVTRAGAVRLDKNYQATTQFESAFAGAVAIPKGQSEYPNLVRAFLRQVYSDSAFVEAIKK